MWQWLFVLSWQNIIGIRVFWDVTLCHWASSSCCSEGTTILWNFGNDSPNTGSYLITLASSTNPCESLASCSHTDRTCYTVKVSVGFLSHSKWNFMILLNSWIEHPVLCVHPLTSHTCTHKKLACNHLISVHIQSNITTQKQYIVNLMFTPLSITKVMVMYTCEVLEFLGARLFQRDSQLVIQTARCSSAHLPQKSDVTQLKILTASFNITTLSTTYISIK